MRHEIEMFHWVEIFAKGSLESIFVPIQYPGWMVNSEGSVFIATANDNAVGMYTCTPYNSYGTMGQSEPTRVILKVRLLFSTQVFSIRKMMHTN